MGCERPAEVKKPKTYQKSGLQFRYPENWKITQDSETDGVRDILIETPGSALVTISIASGDDGLGIEEFAREYSQKVRSVSPNLNMGPSIYGEPEESNGYKTLHEQFPLRFLGEEVHITEFTDKSSLAIKRSLSFVRSATTTPILLRLVSSKLLRRCDMTLIE